MKIASFIHAGMPAYGIVDDESVTPVAKEFQQRFPDLRSVLAAQALDRLAAAANGTPLHCSTLEFLPTISNPDKVICVGVNYRPHLEEMGRAAPEHPMIFVRFAGSQSGHLQPLRKSPAMDKYDFEGELAVIIGRSARHVPRAAAYDYVAGYTCFMDGTARDWQNHTAQFTPGKNFHHSGAMGPWLVTADEIADVGTLRLQTRINGEVMQQGRIDELIFDIPRLIAYLSTFTELLPGDVIATGTPGGVGAARTPPRWLSDGDEVVVDITGIGCLRNRVQAD